MTAGQDSREEMQSGSGTGAVMALWYHEKKIYAKIYAELGGREGNTHGGAGRKGSRGIEWRECKNKREICHQLLHFPKCP